MQQRNEVTSEEINQLVVDNQGWAESIARSVARSWNMDWEQDGLGSAALEALLFCAKRFDPSLGVPFRGYARKRVHEASTEEARRSRSWKTGLVNSSKKHQKAREISAQLFDVFPELREGQLPFSDQGGGDTDLRGAIRQILMGATLLASRESIASALPDDVMDYKKMIESAAHLELLHQILIWKVYWEGYSLRSLALEWETDELNVMREHKSLLTYLHKSMGTARNKVVEKPRIRPALRAIALKLKRENKLGPFRQCMEHQNPSGESHGTKNR